MNMKGQTHMSSPNKLHYEHEGTNSHEQPLQTTLWTLRDKLTWAALTNYTMNMKGQTHMSSPKKLHYEHEGTNSHEQL